MRLSVNLFAFFVFALCAHAANPSISLDGDWDLDYWEQPDEAPIRNVPVAFRHKRIPASVPGNCELDLVRAGVIPPAEIGLNCFRMRSLEANQWLYSKRFVAPELREGEHLRLVFDAIDTLADVFVNGKKVGESDNMLIPASFDITSAVRPGETNLVQVLIRSVMLEAREEVVGQLGHFTGGGADAEPFRKAFHMGGWDILPRLFVAGLSRSVRVETVCPYRIDCVNWMVKNLSKDRTRADLNVYSRIRAPWKYIENASVRYRLNLRGETQFEDVRPYHITQNYITFTFSNPELWWPRGAGDPTLYDATIELLSEDGAVLASDARRIGIRTVRLERRDWRSRNDPGQFLFYVNGEPIFIRGTNWVPIDAFHGRDAELIGPVLEMLADLNCNMVRVWGGGVYELDRFYDWCDANGVMVWQDFMMGCAVFPQNPEFLSRFRKEVLSTVLRLRDHPSIALWSGNNENDLFHVTRVGRELAPDPNLDLPSRQVVPDVLREFDVSRPYLPSSPYCSPDVVAGKARASENHIWGGATHWKSGYYTNDVARFVSETGYHGCPRVETLKEMFSPDCVYPWTNRTDKTSFNAEWRFKATAPFMDPKFQPVLWSRPSMYVDTVRRFFGCVPDDLGDFVEASEIVQAEALKFWIEMHRTAKFGRSNGLLWWNLRDGWPVLSDAVVDYYNRKKMAYFAIRAVQQDVLVAVRDVDRHLVAVNDRLRPVSGYVKVTDVVSGRVLYDGSFSVPANGLCDLQGLDLNGLEEKGVLKIDGKVDEIDLRNHYLYGSDPFDLTKVRVWLRDRPLFDRE